MLNKGRVTAEVYSCTWDDRRQVVLMRLTWWTSECVCVCVLGQQLSSGRFRWQWWREAISTVIHPTSAFQELHSTHGCPKRPRPGPCRAAVNKSHSSGRECVSVRACVYLLYSRTHHGTSVSSVGFVSNKHWIFSSEYHVWRLSETSGTCNVGFGVYLY